MFSRLKVLSPDRRDGAGSHDRTAYFRRCKGRLEPTGARATRAARHGSGMRGAGDSYNSHHAWCRPLEPAVAPVGMRSRWRGRTRRGVTSLALAVALVAGIALAAAVGAGVAAFVLRRAAGDGAKSDAAASAGAGPRSADVAEAAAATPAIDDTARSDAAAEADHASFGYIVSHDLRAPIRVVEGFTKIVKEDYGAVLDAVGQDHLDRVLGAAARMNSMIDALLQLSRLSSQPIARVPVNLSQIAGFVVDDLRREHPEREVEVEIEPQLLASGDPTLLRMLLENLLGNAWKYTGNTEIARIGLVRRPGETTGFMVHDNGAGFDMRYADRLFGVFQRLHSASEFPGTGVGLASVRRIVRRHQGQVWAESEPERGTRFHFTLPLPARIDAPT
jgi:signal transduction histidine kinase